jgi:hypothetical protein
MSEGFPKAAQNSLIGGRATVHRVRFGQAAPQLARAIALSRHGSAAPAPMPGFQLMPFGEGGPRVNSVEGSAHASVHQRRRLDDGDAGKVA